MLKIENERQREKIAALDADGYFLNVCDDCLKIDGTLSYDTMKAIVDVLSCGKMGDEDLFEECWVAYRRKGSKKKARAYWAKLTHEERMCVLPHVKAYTTTRELVYQKDFERYLRDKSFNDMVVGKDNSVLYDPSSQTNDEYRPQTGGNLTWNEYYNEYVYMGMFYEHIVDGYTDDTRPDGARIMLNNARGVIVWDRENKKWNKK